MELKGAVARHVSMWLWKTTQQRQNNHRALRRREHPSAEFHISPHNLYIFDRERLPVEITLNRKQTKQELMSYPCPGSRLMGLCGPWMGKTKFSWGTSCKHNLINDQVIIHSWVLIPPLLYLNSRCRPDNYESGLEICKRDVIKTPSCPTRSLS